MVAFSRLDAACPAIAVSPIVLRCGVMLPHLTAERAVT
jgi:hypothetical protein